MVIKILKEQLYKMKNLSLVNIIQIGIYLLKNIPFVELAKKSAYRKRA